MTILHLVRNPRIRLLLLIAFLTNGWFVLSNWVFYMSMYVSPAQIGVIDGIAILISILAEVPTGAFADLFGKKNSLIVSRLLTILGASIVALGHNFPALLLGNSLIFLGVAFHSGSKEALCYDTLKEMRIENEYTNFLSINNNISLLMTVIATGVGGFLYALDPRLPWFSWIVTEIIALGALLFVVEPAVDTKKVTFSAYLEQNKEGFLHLFNKDVRPFFVYLLPLLLIPKMVTGIFRQGIAGDFGLNGETLGYLSSGIFLLIAVMSLGFGKSIKKLGEKFFSFLLVLIFATTYLLSFTKIIPGLVGGGIILTVFSIALIFSEQAVSAIINKRIDSKYRATTMSTVSLLSLSSYMLVALFFGKLASPAFIDVYYGIMLGVSLLFLGAMVVSWLLSEKAATIRKWLNSNFLCTVLRNSTNL